MANTQAMCTSFKGELLQGIHVFTATNPARTVNTADAFKAALFTTAGSLGAGTQTYSTTNEVSGTNYTAGGVAITTGGWAAIGLTAPYTTPSANIVYSTVTLATAFDAVLIYNSSQSNKAVSVHTFGSQTVTAGNFTLTMPANGAGTALIQIN